MMQWLNATRATYIGNATAVRDYRTQLRGSKAFWLWGAYLVVLIGVCALAYNQFADQGEQSISQLQQQLTTFYHTVIGMLAGIIVLVAPGLTASAITGERQRRSLDLIFSAPVRPRYLLVGKMIAGLRYLVMLLILALPVVSVCVVMGGATWSDVIGSFINLLACGIVMLAIGLLMSSIIPTNIGAILGSYAAIGIYMILTGMMTVTTTLSSMGSMGGGRTLNVIWFGNIFPFTASYTAPTFTKIGDFEMPNWAIALFYSLLVSKVLLAGAGSALSPYGSAETKSLRVHGLIAAAAVMFLIAGPVAGGLAGSVTSRLTGLASGGTSAANLAAFLGYATCATFFVWPHMMCHSRESERKFWNDGLFSFRGAFRGTPSGSLPYMIMMIVAFGAALWAGAVYFAGSASASGLIPPPPTAASPAMSGMGTPAPVAVATPPSLVGSALAEPILTMLVWCIGFVTLWWGIGRYTSAAAGNLKGARLGLISAIVVLIAIPTPIFSVIAASNWNYSGSSSDPIWKLHLMYPLFSSNGMEQQAFYGIACGVIGFVIALLGETKYRQSNPVTQDV